MSRSTQKEKKNTWETQWNNTASFVHASIPFVCSNCRHMEGTDESRCTCVVGWFLDILAVITSLADIVTDIIVAYQFYDEGEMVWFGLVVASLCAASVVYAAWTIVLPHHMLGRALADQLQNKIPKVVIIPIVFLLSPLLPLIHWIVAKIQQHQTKSRANDGKKKIVDAKSIYAWNDDNPLVQHPAAFPIVNAARSSFIEAIADGIANHSQSHALFYLETVFEALPQSIIQLLALTMNRTFTVAQVVSLSLSIASIASKAYIVSLSYQISTFVFKILLVIFDVFTLFYTFATVMGTIGTDPSYGDELFFGCYATSLTRWWIYTGIALAALCFTFLLVAQPLHAIGVCESTEHPAQDCLAQVGVSLVLVIAAPLILLALTGAKVTWLVFAIRSGMEPHGSWGHAAWRLANAFVNSAPDGRAYRRRLRHLAMDVPGIAVQHFQTHRHLYEPPHDVLVNAPIFAEMAESPSDWSLCKFWYQVELTNIVHLTRFLRVGHYRHLDRLVTLGYILYGTFVVPANLAFPIVHASSHYNEHNTFQTVCFWGSAGALVLILLLLPSQIKHFVFGMMFLPIARCHHNDNVTPQLHHLCASIDKYFHNVAPCGPRIAAAIELEVLPVELVLSVVAPYLGDDATAPLHEADEAEQIHEFGLTLPKLALDTSDFDHIGDRSNPLVEQEMSRRSILTPKRRPSVDSESLNW